MSAQFARAFEPTNVVPLFRTKSSTEPSYAESRASGENIEQLIARIEAAGYQAVIQSEVRSRQSPFDAIYFSSLQPDRVSSSAIRRLRAYAQIEDRSDDFTFDDGLD